MEPMALGSPVGSPAAQQHAPPVSTTSTFIPSYLMGDIASPSASGRVVSSGSTSPNKATRQFSTSTSVSTPGSPQPSKDPFFHSRLGQDKPGGPPTQSLMGIRAAPPTLPQSPIPSHIGSPFIDHGQSTPVMSYGTQGTPVAGYSTPVGPHSQSAYTPGFTPSRLDHPSLLATDLQPSHEVLEDTWVTVFGFPAPAASYILTQFTQFGTITEHQMPGTGNWMHLKYQTKLQARKALSKNGKVFSGNIMVGVVPCSDKNLVSEKENVASLSNIMSPNNTSLSGTPKGNMRPLTQAYQTAHAEHEVIPKVNTPKKNDGLVARAMQHILGL